MKTELGFAIGFFTSLSLILFACQNTHEEKLGATGTPTGTGIPTILAGHYNGTALACDAGLPIYGWDGGPTCLAFPAVASALPDGAVDGNVLEYLSGDATWGAINLAGGANTVTGLLPAGNQTAQTVGGDLSGTTANSTVIGIRGNLVTSSSVAQGDILYANDAGSWQYLTPGTTGNTLSSGGATGNPSWASLNLAGGSAYVTGSLPTANQVSQSLGGDLSGTTTSGTVIAVQGNSFASFTPAQGDVLYWGGSNWTHLAPGTVGNTLKTGGAAANPSWAALNLAGGSAFVTGALPTANQANQSMGGDVTGTTNSCTVAKANGATVPAAGSLTTGNTLQVSGASALSYSALNLAGGANYVSGLLPSANIATPAGWVTALDLDFTAQANQTFSSDGAITIAGNANWLHLNSANEATNTKLINGTGLEFKPVSATTISGATVTLPIISVQLSSLITSGFTLSTPLRVWAHISSQNFTANYDLAGIITHIYNTGGTTTQNKVNQLYSDGQFGIGLSSNGVCFTANSISASLQNCSAGGFTDTAVLFEFPAGVGTQLGPMLYTGTYSGAWPSVLNMKGRIIEQMTGNFLFGNTTSGNNQILDSTNFYAGLAAQRTNSATALTVDFAHFRIDYKN